MGIQFDSQNSQQKGYTELALDVTKSQMNWESFQKAPQPYADKYKVSLTDSQVIKIRETSYADAKKAAALASPDLNSTAGMW